MVNKYQSKKKANFFQGFFFIKDVPHIRFDYTLSTLRYNINLEKSLVSKISRIFILHNNNAEKYSKNCFKKSLFNK